MGLNSRSYSGINAAVRFGDLDNHRTGSISSSRPEDRDVRRPQGRDGDSLFQCLPPLSWKRKGPAGHAILSHFFPTPLLQPTTVPRCAKPINPKSRHAGAHSGHHSSPDVLSFGIVRWDPSSCEAPAMIWIVSSRAAHCQGLSRKKEENSVPAASWTHEVAGGPKNGA